LQINIKLEVNNKRKYFSKQQLRMNSGKY